MLSCLYLFAVVSLAANSPPVSTPAAAESQGKRVVVSGLKAAGVTADVVQVMAGQIRSDLDRPASAEAPPSGSASGFGQGFGLFTRDLPRFGEDLEVFECSVEGPTEVPSHYRLH